MICRMWLLNWGRDRINPASKVLEDETSVGNGSRNLRGFLGGLESEWS